MDPQDISRIVEMAWEDRTPFDAIKRQFAMTESDVIRLMRRTLKASSFRLWRKRVGGRSTKHEMLTAKQVNRAYCPTQYKVKKSTV